MVARTVPSTGRPCSRNARRGLIRATPHSWANCCISRRHKLTFTPSPKHCSVTRGSGTRTRKFRRHCDALEGQAGEVRWAGPAPLEQAVKGFFDTLPESILLWNQRQSLSANYTRLHLRSVFSRCNGCSVKCKNPGFSGVFCAFLLYEAAALTAELRRPDTSFARCRPPSERQGHERRVRLHANILGSEAHGCKGWRQGPSRLRCWEALSFLDLRSWF